MFISFTRFSWLWFGGKEVDQNFNSSVQNAIKSVNEFGTVGSRREPESLKFNSTKQAPSSSSNKKMKKKWKSKEEKSKKIDKEYDVVLVASDEICLSESESDSSDWSIGWLEPHCPEFQIDEEGEESFAVLVPCYKHNSEVLIMEKVEDKLHFAGYSDETSEILQWLSSLQKSENTTVL